MQRADGKIVNPFEFYMLKSVRFPNGLKYRLNVSDDNSILVFKSEGKHRWMPNNVDNILYEVTMRVELYPDAPKFIVASLQTTGLSQKKKDDLHTELLTEFPKWYEAWTKKFPSMFKMLIAKRDKKSVKLKLIELKETAQRMEVLLEVFKSQITHIETLL